MSTPWVSKHHFNFFAIDGATHIRNGHLDGFYAGLPINIGIQAGHVSNDADANHVTGNLCVGARAQSHCTSKAAGGGNVLQFHAVSFEVIGDGRKK
jgi:hypothetical protein